MLAYAITGTRLPIILGVLSEDVELEAVLSLDLVSSESEGISLVDESPESDVVPSVVREPDDVLLEYFISKVYIRVIDKTVYGTCPSTKYLFPLNSRVDLTLKDN